MRKLGGVVVLIAMVAVIGLAVAQARVPDMTWTGYITDSACADKKAMWGNHDCAVKCVKEKGASWVFVTSKEGKVVKIQNQDAVKDENVGVEVKLTGNMTDDGAVHINKVEHMKM
jgi:hypothetical protein